MWEDTSVVHWLHSQKGREYNDAQVSWKKILWLLTNPYKVPYNQELFYIRVYSVYKKVQQIMCKCQTDTYAATEYLLLPVLIIRVFNNTWVCRLSCHSEWTHVYSCKEKPAWCTTYS